MKRIIKIYEGKLYVAPDSYLNASQVLSPARISFRQNISRFLEVEIQSQNDDVIFKITNYYSKDEAAFNSQKQKRDINQIFFHNIDYWEFEALLTSYNTASLLSSANLREPPAFINVAQRQLEISSKTLFACEIIESRKIDFEIPLSEENRQVTIYSDVEFQDFAFEVRWECAEFQDGEYPFQYSVPGRDKLPISMTIYNQYLRSEFRYIAPYFEKLFNSKWFIIGGTIKYINGKFSEVTALDSKELSQINELTIAQFRERQIKRLSSVMNDDNDNSLHSISSLIEKLPDEFDKSNALELQSTNIIDYFTGDTEIRNREHINFLSTYQEELPQKLLFTVKPNFGFLFSIETNSAHCFIWELLNSHATYIWIISKSTCDYDCAKDRIETSISQIIADGRARYKQAYGANEVDTDIAFTLITHKENGFNEWKSEIEVILHSDYLLNKLLHIKPH